MTNRLMQGVRNGLCVYFLFGAIIVAIATTSLTVFLSCSVVVVGTTLLMLSDA